MAPFPGSFSSRQGQTLEQGSGAQKKKDPDKKKKNPKDPEQAREKSKQENNAKDKENNSNSEDPGLSLRGWFF